MKKQLQRTNNKLLIVACLFTATVHLQAQNIDRIYVNMPDALNPTLTTQNRLELMEYYKASKIDSITNRFGNQAYVEVLDTINQYVVVRNTLNSTFEMMLFRIDNEQSVIGIIRTVSAPVCQSALDFYSLDWKRMPVAFNMPVAMDWIDLKAFENDTVDKNWVGNLMENSFIALRFNPASHEIVATNNSLQFLSDNDRKIVAPFFQNKEICFRLEGQKLVRTSK